MPELYNSYTLALEFMLQKMDTTVEEAHSLVTTRKPPINVGEERRWPRLRDLSVSSAAIILLYPGCVPVSCTHCTPSQEQEIVPATITGGEY